MISSQEHILILSIEYFVGGNSSEHNYSSIRMISPIGRNLFLDRAVLCSRISRGGIISAVLSMQGLQPIIHSIFIKVLYFYYNKVGMRFPAKCSCLQGKAYISLPSLFQLLTCFPEELAACRIIVIKREFLACLPSSSRNECIPVSSPTIGTCRPDARLTYSVNDLEILDINYSFFT